MSENDINSRLTEIELVVAHQQKIIDDLNDVVISQGKMLENLMLQHKQLCAVLSEDVVKPLSEEVPPPHY